LQQSLLFANIDVANMERMLFSFLGEIMDVATVKIYSKCALVNLLLSLEV